MFYTLLHIINKTGQTVDAPTTSVCATTAEKPSIWAPRSLQPFHISLQSPTHTQHNMGHFIGQSLQWYWQTVQENTQTKYNSETTQNTAK